MKTFKMWKPVLFILFSLHVFRASCIEFHRNAVGVSFSPFVKQAADEGKQFNFKSYTFGNVKTLLTVVSQKFSKVLVEGIYSMHAEYVENVTYHNGSYACVYSGEVAAQINQKNGKKVLSLIYNINLPSEIDWDVPLVLEAAEKANRIFPGTVEGISVGLPVDMLDQKDILYYLLFYSERALELEIKLGAKLQCSKFFYTSNNTWFHLQKKIVIQSSFIICDGFPLDGYEFLGAESAYTVLAKEIIAAEEFIRQLSADTEVLHTAGWSSSGSKDWETIDNLGVFWEAANNWAFRNNNTIYMKEAFDTPWRSKANYNSMAYRGWWKLASNSKINFIDGYVEKAVSVNNNVEANIEKNSSKVPGHAVKLPKKISPIEFNQTYFGVEYCPFVKTFTTTNEFDSSFAFYTAQNVKTALTVVSTKFRRILVSSHFTKHVRYWYNFTYYHGSTVDVYSGEVAARINREKEKKVLSLLYHVRQIRFDVHDVGISLALEAAWKANEIFPNTVNRIAISRSTFKADSELLYSLQAHKKIATQLDLKLGSCLHCNTIFDSKNHTQDNVQEQVLKESDFVVCQINRFVQTIGPFNSFYALTIEMLGYREYIQTFNKKAKVIMLLVGWSTSGSNDWETVENLYTYWKAASKWAHENKFMIYMESAIDAPITNSSNGGGDKRGWWSLVENSKINVLEAYVEKVTDINASVPYENNTKENHILSSDWNWGIISLSVAAVAFTICILVLLILLYNKKRGMPLSAHDVKEFIFGISKKTEQKAATALESAISAPYARSLEIPKDRLKIDEQCILGSGQFGFVYKALLEDDGIITEVALKVAKSNCQSAGLKGLLAEIKIMTYLGKHLNIVSLEGAYTAELLSGVVYVATEFCSLGSLQSFLRSNSSTQINETEERDATFCDMDNTQQEMTQLSNALLSLHDMYRWSHEIACGMEFLEGKYVVHADLATRNVLLTSKKTAKIADFGLSRRMYNYQNYKKEGKEPLPWRWMAIESLENMVFSSKSDVWSYGVTLWEIFSKGAVPYPGVEWTQDFLDELINGLHPSCPPLAPDEMYGVMQKCWTREPNKRPSFSELVICTNTLTLRQ